MKKIILFDIDHTLIDSDLLYKLINNNLTSSLKINKTAYMNLRRQYLNSLLCSNDFNADDFIKLVAKKFNKNQKLVYKYFLKQPKLYQQALFLDTKPALTKLSKKYTLGIFSEGFTKFQTFKIKNAKIDHFFAIKHIYIFRRKLKKSALINLPKKVIIIDDNLQVLKNLNKLNQFNLIYLNRKSRKTHPQIPTIHKLNQLTSII
ncbi:hypothetical protein A2164_03295 [Candidatus Curtissbacteria bacterium RBG_13_35_7]|uniref:FCP1 homology domain-containing protein n=1 Tax=Candidatus Curtissbacteria bacterium RBG_13_35_7 TaxID=1797705 RepID=A0A1F5G385_9BACT|nr:MAG: hypothetical protein A2164_03295 [Candidatus Curtissbacteria bacterium RBG_13_35_7]